jgi:hypothetical protein
MKHNVFLIIIRIILLARLILSFKLCTTIEQINAIAIEYQGA